MLLGLTFEIIYRTILLTRQHDFEGTDMNDYVIYFIGCIFLFLMSVSALVKSILSLRRALIFYGDCQNGRTIKAKAVITDLRRSTSVFGCTASARARYVIQREQINGKMICRFDDRLQKGQNVKVIVSGTKQNIFAVDAAVMTPVPEVQIKNALLTYSVFCVLSLALVAGVVLLSVLIFPKLL